MFPLEPELPLIPDDPDDPLPPDAPSKLIVQEVNVPVPTVLVGVANVNMLDVYDITSHS